MRNMIAATLYPGIGAIEGTNISVGRGTDTPFEQLGAPWIDGPALAAALNASALPGDPLLSGDVHARGRRQARRPGVPRRVPDRHRSRSRCGRCASACRSRRRCRRLYGTQFTLEDAATLFGPKAMLEKIRAGADPAAIAASWAADEAKWRLTRAKYLLYSASVFRQRRLVLAEAPLDEPNQEIDVAGETDQPRRETSGDHRNRRPRAGRSRRARDCCRIVNPGIENLERR